MKNVQIGKSLLLFLLCLSSSISVSFIYPFLYEFIKVYNSDLLHGSVLQLGIVFGLLISCHEISRIFGSLIWKKIANVLGLNMCVILSLVFIGLINLIFCFVKDVWVFIILRLFFGALNAIPIILKTFIFELFNSESQAKMLGRYQLFSNLSMALGFLLGSIQLENLTNSSEENAIIKSTNKFYLPAVILLIINFSTLILNISINKCKFRPRRTLSIKDHFDIKTEIDTTPKRKESQGNKEEGFENFSIRSSTMGNKRNSLVLYNNTEKAEENNESKDVDNLSSHYLDSIMNKDEINEEEYSPKSNPDNDKEKDASVYDIMRNRQSVPLNRKLSGKKQKPIENSKDQEEFSQVEIEHTNNDKIEDSDKPYQNLENDTKLITNNNNLTNLGTNRLMHSYNDDKDVVVKIQFLEMEKKKNFEDGGKEILKNSKRNSHEFIGKEGEDIEVAGKMNHLELSNKPERSITGRSSGKYSTSNNSLVLKNMQVKNSFKISCIFTLIQISEVSLFNLFLLVLYSTNQSIDTKIEEEKNHENIYFPYSQLGLCLFTVYLLYTLVNYLFSKMKINIKKVKRSLKINLLISTITTIFIIAPLSTELNNKIKILLVSIIFLIRNISLTNCLTCYNILINKLENPKLKEKINNYQLYFSNSLRSIFSIISAIVIIYLQDIKVNVFSNILDNKAIWILISVYSSLILTIFLLIKYI